jgi:branched-chain amino acid transport system permease protein
VIREDAEAQATTAAPFEEAVAGTGGHARLLPAARPWAQPNWVGIAITLLVMLPLPWLMSVVDGGRFITHLVITFFIWGMVTQCWNLIMGVSGIYSFAQLALFGVGVFTTGALSQSFGVSPWISIWVAPVVTVLAALLVGLPTLRLRGIYVVLLTLAFHELLRNFITTGPRWLSGQGYGLVYVPRLGFDRILGDNDIVLYYYFGFLLFGITSFAIWRILHSPIGLGFTALRDSEEYAISRGIDPFRFKLLLFAFSAFFTGLAGGFSAHYLGSASTTLFNFSFAVNLLAMIVLGGWGTFLGPIVGTAVVTFLFEFLRAVDAYRYLSVGLAMAIIAVAAPQGLVAVVTSAFKGLFGAFFLPEEEEEVAEPPAGISGEQPEGLAAPEESTL